MDSSRLTSASARTESAPAPYNPQNLSQYIVAGQAKAGVTVV